MTRRAQQILVASQRGRAAGGAEAALLPWSGTFHSIGNRLLRRHAATLSLDPAFTVLDRADSADLMDLVRSDLGLARTRSRFPKKGRCLAIYSYSVNAGCPLEETLVESFPWCDAWEAELKRLFAEPEMDEEEADDDGIGPMPSLLGVSAAWRRSYARLHNAPSPRPMLPYPTGAPSPHRKSAREPSRRWSQ